MLENPTANTVLLVVMEDFRAVGQTYDVFHNYLASFTWPGWDEPGVELGGVRVEITWIIERMRASNPHTYAAIAARKCYQGSRA